MSIELLIYGAKAYIKGTLPSQVVQDLIDICSYRPEDYIFSSKYLSGQWDGYIRLFRNNRFPVGLLSSVQLILELHGIDYQIRDLRRVETPKPLKSNVVLRDYQERVLNKALEKGSGLIVLPAGSGKTELAIEITARLGLPTLFIAPTQEIFYQSHSRFENALGIEIGMIGDQIFEPKRISIALWQTIWSGIKQRKQEIIDLLKQYNVVFWDEAHHVSADCIYTVSQYCPARYRFGLTATPYSRNNAELKFIGACGDLIKEVTASDLIKMGYLVKPYIEFAQSERMFFPRYVRWNEVYKKGVVFNENRNSLIADFANRLKEEDRITLILVTEIKHGTKLNSMIDESVFVHASASERRDIVEKFKNREIPILISTPIFDEGISINCISGMILAGAGKSPIKAVQRVGRGLRTDEGKKDVKIIDFNDPIKWLFEHSYQRYKIYSEEPEFEITGAIPRGI